MRFPLRISDQSEDKQATSVVSHHHPNIQFLRCHGVFFPEKKNTKSLAFVATTPQPELRPRNDDLTLLHAPPKGAKKFKGFEASVGSAPKKKPNKNALGFGAEP